MTDDLPLPPLNEEEQAALDALNDFMQRVRYWGLRANHGEYTAAIHVLQGFVIQHALVRIDPRWGQWYDR
jgi:hypothetical protein